MARRVIVLRHDWEGVFNPPFPDEGQGLCLWCSRKLRAEAIGTTNPEGHLGRYQDNAFCGLRCGYRFGVMFASFGNRLMVKEETG